MKFSSMQGRVGSATAAGNVQLLSGVPITSPFLTPRPRITGTGWPSTTHPPPPTEKGGIPPRSATSDLFVVTFSPTSHPQSARLIGEASRVTSKPWLLSLPMLVRWEPPNPFDGVRATLKRASDVVCLKYVSVAERRPSSHSPSR